MLSCCFSNCRASNLAAPDYASTGADRLGGQLQQSILQNRVTTDMNVIGALGACPHAGQNFIFVLEVLFIYRESILYDSAMPLSYYVLLKMQKRLFCYSGGSRNFQRGFQV